MSTYRTPPVRQPQFGYYAGKDELGRTVVSHHDVPKPRENRYVGIFYFQWLGQHGTGGPYDISQIIEEAPEAVHDPDHPLWGPEKQYHFWGEPLYGYYLSDDEWVLRKHVQLLTNAGIDFLVFDTTNAVVYYDVHNKLFRVMDEIQKQGWDVPKIVFYTNTKSGETIKHIYDDVYQPERYSDLWFYWDGKPLIIGDPDECSAEIQHFFTFRLNQWPNEAQKTNGFPWTEFQRPQRVFFNDRGEKEVINVGVAQHPSVAMSDTPFYHYGENWGRSYRGNQHDPSPDGPLWGHNIAEQWEFALEEDPQIVFLTGWNEWVAMRLPGSSSERPILFVDQCTLDFSRDIEPMQGGYMDTYYLQMLSYIRRFKGMDALPVSQPGTTIHITGEFNQWQDIGPEFKDFTDDTTARNHGGFGGVTYTNDSGRNDFETLKVTRDADNVYFYARTVQPITPYTDRNWMMLLLKIDETSEVNWKGYDFVVNHHVINESRTTLKRSLGGWQWEKVSDIDYNVHGNELHLAIPLSDLGLDPNQGNVRFEFKWSDNMQDDGDPMDFYVNGDTAPDGRLNFIYTEGD